MKGAVSRTYNNNFRITSTSVNGSQPVNLQYDPDGLLVQAGALTLNRDGRNGLITGTKLGNLTTSQEYNGFGQWRRFSAAFDNKEIFVVQYERDALGRISNKIETVAGQKSTYTYAHDLAGRLIDVTKNGVKIAHYEYDSNGNRLKYRGPKSTLSGRYDAQDRVVNYGNTTYTHTANGEWLSKTINGKTTAYNYDAFGNLRVVTLPDGTKIEYFVDGRNRRIGKKVNGKPVQGFLYQDALRPVAELDGQNNVVSRFVYTTKINVPEYMEKGGKTYRIITDHLGGPRLVVDVATGEIAQRMDRDEFGNVLEDSNPGFQPFGFAGGLYDQGTKLVRFGARDYDASTGRWTAKDPILGPDSNLFAYALNDPVNLYDRNGLDPEDPWKETQGVIKPITGVVGVAGFVAKVSGSARLATYVTGPAGVVGAFGTGLFIGGQMDRAYEKISGQSLGEDIYDWTEENPCWPVGRCGGGGDPPSGEGGLPPCFEQQGGLVVWTAPPDQPCDPGPPGPDDPQFKAPCNFGGCPPGHTCNEETGECDCDAQDVYWIPPKDPTDPTRMCAGVGCGPCEVPR